MKKRQICLLLWCLDSNGVRPPFFPPSSLFLQSTGVSTEYRCLVRTLGFVLYFGEFWPAWMVLER
ncbi:hypothetical protein LguiA_013679 [Lonicera macranthoides]